MYNWFDDEENDFSSCWMATRKGEDTGYKKVGTLLLLSMYSVWNGYGTVLRQTKEWMRELIS